MYICDVPLHEGELKRRSVMTVNALALAALVLVAVIVLAVPALHRPPQPVFERTRQHQDGAVLVSDPASLEPLWANKARAVAQDVVAQPEIASGSLQRVAARPPLGALGLAPPPRRIGPDDWDGVLMYRPSVTSSASFVAMGYTIYIAGIEGIDAGETCIAGVASWPCGERAMLAFRYFLRGRAPLCQVLPPAERQPVAAACRLGKQDVGAWLVVNGWARARPGGGYEKGEQVAKQAMMGIFGTPD